MNLDLQNIQGNIAPGFNKDHQAFLRVRFFNDGAARQWLRKILPLISSAAEVRAYKDLFKLVGQRRAGDETSVISATWINVAFSFEGLKLLEDIADRFPGEFDRNRVPGAKKADKPVHAMLLVGADRSEDRTRVVSQLTTMVSDYGRLVGPPFLGDALPGLSAGHEHFGFKDGISQPRIQGIDDVSQTGGSVTADRFLINGDESQSSAPGSLPDWCIGGSFLAFAQLQQDVGSFRRELRTAEEQFDLPLDSLGPSLVGRDQNGIQLNPVPEVSHIGRAHPDDAALNPGAHRIIRRGIPYGPPYDQDPTAERGLLFVSYQADIRNQFEHVWVQWLNNANFPKPASGTDGLVGVVGTSRGMRLINVQRPDSQPGQKLQLHVSQFVSPQYGGYFFSPSFAGLAYLARLESHVESKLGGLKPVPSQKAPSHEQLLAMWHALEPIIANGATSSHQGSDVVSPGGTSTVTNPPPASAGTSQGCLDQLVPGGLSDYICRQYPYGHYSDMQPVGLPRVVGTAAAANIERPYSGTLESVQQSNRRINWGVGSESFDITKAIILTYTFTDPAGNPAQGKILIGYNGPPW